MDMITTGRTALDRDLIVRLTEQLREFFSTRSGQRMTVGQIRQALASGAVIQTQPTSGGGGGGGSPHRAGKTQNQAQPAGGNQLGVSVSMMEVEEAVRELMTEGAVQYIERTQTVIIRH
jgi:hypothetical protein